MKPRLPFLLALAAVVLPAAPVLAQEKPPAQPGLQDPKAKGDEGRRTGGRIRMGDLPQDTPQGGAGEGDDAAKPPAPPAPKKSEEQAWVELLAKWPAAEARQASIRLAAQKKVAYPLLLALVEGGSDDWRSVAGAAATLGKIGDAAALDALVARVQDRRMYTHSADLLDAIVRIDPAGAKARLLAQLLHPASAVVQEAAKRLAERVGPSDADALRDVLEAGGPAARAAAVELLARADRTGARTSLAAALRDASPDVAFAAARALAADDAPEAEEALRRATTTAVDRQLAYASLALALRSERTGKRTIDDATARLLLGGRGLAGVDPLSQAAAAVTLADLGYFYEVPGLDEVLDRRIVPELIDVVSGHEFWPDLRVFQPIALRRLQRLTGRSGVATAEEWMGWWQQAAPTFRARRVLQEIPADATAGFSLSVRGSQAFGGEGTTLAASQEGLAWAAPSDFVALLDAETAQALVSTLNTSGLLRQSEAGAGAEGLAPVEIVIRAGRRERRIAARPDDSAAVRQAIAEVALLRDRLSWQRYRATSQAIDLPSFVATMGPKFAAERSQAQRDATLAGLITSSLSEARGEAWNVRALEHLRSLADLGDALGDEGTRHLLRVLGQRTEVDAVAEGVVLALAKARRPEAHPLLLDFLLTRSSPRCADLLVTVFRDADAKSLAEGLGDERVPVRAAALAALDENSPRELAEGAVRKALADADLEVRRQGVRALGRLRCEWARADLESMAGKPGDLRGAAVEALGRLGGKSALPALMGAFSADDPGLRVAAIEALGATREPEAISAIAFAMTLDPSAMVREVASRVIVEFGTDRAAAELRRLALDRAQPAGPRARAVSGLVLLAGTEALRDLGSLVDDPADEVAEEAAVALAYWRDPAAVPRLIRMLEQGHRARAARQGLESISLESFAQEDDQLVAGLYTGWWETTRDRGPRGWLVDALVLSGQDDPVLREWEKGQASRAAAPALLRALRDERWAVRRAADLALRDIAQRKFGEQGPFTTPSESARIAAAWEDWWAAQAPADTSR